MSLSILVWETAMEHSLISAIITFITFIMIIEILMIKRIELRTNNGFLCVVQLFTLLFALSFIWKIRDDN